MQNKDKKAVILLSGGLDSAVTMALAKSQGFDLYALTFRYGQRHSIEIEAARRIAKAVGIVEHRVINLDLPSTNGSALTDKTKAIPKNRPDLLQEGAIPITYVPARNTIMLSLALAWAETLDCQDIFVGVNTVDYSGYPDCRPEYIKAFESMANLATKAAIEGKKLTIHVPLIYLSKKEIIQTGFTLGVDYNMTVSCYQADETGLACGVCDSCRIRRAGFEAVGKLDPTRYKTLV